MPPRRPLSLTLFAILLVAGCERASRYPATSPLVSPPAKAQEKKERPSVPVHWGWQETTATHDVPIVFIHADSQPDEWKQLPHYWNNFPAHFAGMRTLHLGQSPLGAALAMSLADQMQIVKIKVPFGLPDPAPHIPESNPPTLGKWLLGKRLFFDAGWLAGDGRLSCASCHHPNTGFTERQPPGSARRMNAPSLINAVYNSHQFWDGRMRDLEQVLQQQLEDEAGPDGPMTEDEMPVVRHVWSGIVQRLDSKPEYRAAFRQVFGIRSPTADATAKALATYMRTILSGNSLYDQAREFADKQGDKKLAGQHFAKFLDDDVLTKLQRADRDKENVAVELARGYRLFHASYTRCAECHSGWNFTNNSFHNISIRESDHVVNPFKWEGAAYGRFLHLPIGMKDARMIGAFRTPALRNLPRTAPYFHDGSRDTLEAAVEWYNTDIHHQVNTRLDPVLRAEPGKALQMRLALEEVEALALFLRALDGEPISAVVAGTAR